MEILENEDSCWPNKRLKLNGSDEDSFINYPCGPPSLKSISMVVLAASMWDNPDVKELMKKCCRNCDTTSYFRPETNRKKVEDYIIQKLDVMAIPKLLKAEVSKIVKPMGLPLYEFLGELNVGLSNFDVFLGQQSLVYWTMEGIIDKVASLKELIKYETKSENKPRKIDKSKLYELACNYCLEEHISALRLSLSSDEMNKFADVHSTYQYHLVAYWNSVAKDNLISLMESFKKYDDYGVYDLNLNPIQNMVSYCIYIGNTFSLKYFWFQLKEEERKPHFRIWLELVMLRLEACETDGEYFLHANIMVFLLTNLNDPLLQKEVLLSEDSTQIDVLNALYKTWPLQRYFLPTISALLNNLSEIVHTTVMENIAYDLGDEAQVVNSFREIWYISPLRIKTLFLQGLDSCSIAIFYLIVKSEFQLINSLLHEASSEQKKRIIFNIVSRKKFALEFNDVALDFITPACKLNSIDKLLSETFPTKSDAFMFKLKLLVKIVNIVFINPEMDSICDNFISWVFKSMHVCEFPNNIGVELIPMEVYCAIAHLDNLNFLDEFVNWYFQNQADICTFKESLFHDDNSEAMISIIKHFSERGVSGWERCKKFLDYSFCSKEAISQIRQFYLSNLHDIFFDPYDFQDQINFLNPFLNWCFESRNELVQFKNDLLLSSQVVSIWYPLVQITIINNLVEEWCCLYEYLNWFSPSKKIISDLSNLLRTNLLDYNQYYNECEGLCSLRYKKEMFNQMLGDIYKENVYSNNNEIENSNFDIHYLLNEFSCYSNVVCEHGPMKGDNE